MPFSFAGIRSRSAASLLRLERLTIQAPSAYNSSMAKTTPSPFPFPPRRTYEGADVPMRVIRRYARAIAEEFHPDKIVLFGSYAYGTPNEDSDVDLLVIMPARDPHSQAVRIRWRLAAPFPVDLIIRTPYEINWRLKDRESFTTTIMSQGKVLYEKKHARVGEESRGRLPSRKARTRKQNARS